MKFIAALIRVLVGATFGLLSAIALLPALAAMTPAEGGGAAPIATLVIVLVGAALGCLHPVSAGHLAAAFS